MAYVSYDIDKNGINELIYGVSDKENENFTPTSIYAYNSEEDTAEKVFFTSTIERGTLEIYDNGIIFDSGSGGANLHYYQFGEIADDGYSYEMIEEIEEEYPDEKSDPIYRDASTEEKLKYKSLDEITDKYLEDAEVVDFVEIRKNSVIVDQNEE